MTKLKIVLIDDEIHALKHIEKLITNVSPKYEIIKTFTNAHDAMEALSHMDVDLILLDIMMPVIDGLTFAEEYLKLKPYTQVILLTSYQDFEFAKKAVKIGVCDYWIKNELRPSTIAQKLQSAQEAVDHALIIKQSVEIQEISTLVHKKAPFSSIFGEKNLKCRYFFLVVKNQENTDIWINFKDKLSQVLLKADINQSVFAPNLHSHYSICEIARSKLTEINRDWDLLKPELLQTFSDSGLPCVILGNYFEETDFSTYNFEQFMNAADNFHPEPCESLRIISHEQLSDYRTDSELYNHFNSSYFLPFLDTIETCEINDAMIVIYKIWNDHYNKVGNDSSISFCINRLWEISKSLSSMSSVPKAFSDVLSEYKHLSINDIQTKIMDIYSSIFSSWKAKVPSPSQRVSLVIRYIKTYYQKDLKLSLLENEFGLSADYLRKLFKRETGISITDYITKVRMTAAQDLLKTRKYKIYEVSELVGYHSSAYFSQAFFKCNGYYPSENITEDSEVQ